MSAATVAVVAAAATGAALAGAAAGWFGASRRRRPRAADPRSVTPAPEPTIPAGAEAVLAVLESSAVVLGGSDEVVLASAPALAMGFVGDGRITDASIMQLVRQVRRDGEVRETNVQRQPLRGSTVELRIRVAPLTSRLILVLALDRTQEKRVEAIRRDFVANVSHELKTPVGALTLLAEAVAEASEDPAAVERFSSRMLSEAERLNRLVQQIIDLSRLQNDVASENSVYIKVEELVLEAREHSATEAERKDITVATRVEPDLLVHGDRAQLHAAVANLIENAVAYSPEGSQVAVTAKLDLDRMMVRISVADNGIGIAEDELGRIFERFYRVDPARARATGGTGLGLSIVKHVAASNGGTVDVWSEPGAGSTFTLVLPAQDEDLTEEIL